MTTTNKKRAEAIQARMREAAARECESMAENVRWGHPGSNAAALSGAVASILRGCAANIRALPAYSPSEDARSALVDALAKRDCEDEDMDTGATCLDVLEDAAPIAPEARCWPCRARAAIRSALAADRTDDHAPASEREVRDGE